MYDVIAIGAGTAGLTVAKLAANAGKKVLLVERDRPGGDCLWTGCVPTKAIIECSRRLHEARTSHAFGVLADSVRFDFQKVRERVTESQALAGEIDSPETIRSHGIDFMTGTVSFVDPHTISIDGQRESGRHVVIATGGEPSIPPIPGLAECGPDTNVQAVAWEELPRSLAVIGGGPIGIEFAQALNRLGVTVTVLEVANRILERDEPGASEVISTVLRDEGVTIHTGARLAEVTETGGQKMVRYTGQDGITATVPVERVLVAAGRRPEVASLQLEKAGVDATAKGITVDSALRTSQPHIFAAGDVTGGLQFTHVAEDQGRFIANYLKAGSLARRGRSWNGRVVPRVTYTDPEVASAGLTEHDARATRKHVRVWDIPLAEVDRAIIMRRTEGYIRLITARGWHRWIPGASRLAGDEIVGVSIVAPHAGELLMPVVTAMRMRLPIGLVAWNMQAYPTLSLGVRQAAGLPFS